MKDFNNVYIGRAGIVFIDKQRFPKQSSSFANPFKIGKDGTRNEVLEKYKTYITNKLNDDEELQKELINLEGKNLGCWCASEPCHGDILIELIKEYLIKLDYKYFDGECCICEINCNELDGWKCIKCDKCYCNKYNDEAFLCKC